MPHPAICYLPVIPMRLEPSDRSEMVSQLLFGEDCFILESNEKWHFIESAHDHYRGWVDKKQVTESDSPQNRSLNTSPCVMRDQFNNGYRLSPGSYRLDGSLIGGNSFTIVSEEPYPSNQQAFAEQFLGTPYLWGGRSIHGIDCSGFTQLIARFNLQSLPRDAHQQAELGETVTFVQESQTGDLAFFDNAEGKIIHVGMILSEGKNIQIIHASGQVRIDDLDHEGIFKKEIGMYTHRLRIIKRY